MLKGLKYNFAFTFDLPERNITDKNIIRGKVILLKLYKKWHEVVTTINARFYVSVFQSIRYYFFKTIEANLHVHNDKNSENALKTDRLIVFLNRKINLVFRQPPFLHSELQRSF